LIKSKVLIVIVYLCLLSLYLLDDAKGFIYGLASL